MLKVQQWLWGIVVLHTALVAQDVLLEPREGGLIHTKQKGRYDVVIKLPEQANSFDQAFDFARPYGTFRAANVATQQEALAAYAIDEQKTSATAVGGVFGFKTAALYGLSAQMAASFSQKINAVTPANPDNQNRELFNATGNSYVYIPEALLLYKQDNLKVQLGRFGVNTPYADSDDIRMSANTFEGASFHINYDTFSSDAIYLRRWAGVDSGDDVDVFKPLVEEGRGLGALSLTYALDAKNSLSAWYYFVDKMSDIYYLEGAGEIGMGDYGHMEWGLQGAHIQERSDSGIAGDVLGAMMIADFEILYFGLAYNHVFEQEMKTITDGFGGGPYYTSLDEQTIGSVSALSPGKDLGVYRVTVGIDMSRLGIKQLNLELIHGHFTLHDAPAEAIESDFVLTYQINERWYFESIYADVDLNHIDYSDPQKRALRDFKRLVTRLDYSF